MTGLSNNCSLANVIFDGRSGKQSSAVLWFNAIVRWFEIPVNIRLQERTEMLAHLQARKPEVPPLENSVSKNCIAAAEAAELGL